MLHIHSLIYIMTISRYPSHITSYSSCCMHAALSIPFSQASLLHMCGVWSPRQTLHCSISNTQLLYLQVILQPLILPFEQVHSILQKEVQLSREADGVHRSYIPAKCKGRLTCVHQRLMK